MTESEVKSIAVIGGGAAGFFCAVCVAAKNPSASVTIYEATEKPLAKVLISGGGRCNVTSNTFDVTQLVENYPRGRKELRGPFSRFQPKDTVEWFESRGVKLKAEPDKRMFPTTDNSQTVANCLTAEAKKLEVRLQCKAKLTAISKPDKFELRFRDGSSQSADQVILATGGARAGFEFARKLGHTIADPVPSLFSFEMKEECIEGLAGVSFQNAELKLTCNGKKFLQQGPILITHWGLSGPAIIKLSSLAARELFETDYQAKLTVNFSGKVSGDSGLEILHERKRCHPQKLANKDCPFDVPKSFWSRILNIAGIEDGQTWANVSKKQMYAILDSITAAKLKVLGKGRFKEEFVTCGGVNLSEVDFRTMESKICPGLYFAGEVLDIDGLTGGYNFQSAWTTAWIAGQSL